MDEDRLCACLWVEQGQSFATFRVEHGATGLDNRGGRRGRYDQLGQLRRQQFWTTQLAVGTLRRAQRAGVSCLGQQDARCAGSDNGRAAADGNDSVGIEAPQLGRSLVHRRYRTVCTHAGEHACAAALHGTLYQIKQHALALQGTAADDDGALAAQPGQLTF